MRLLGSAQSGIYPQIGVGLFQVDSAADNLEGVFIDEVFASTGGLTTREQLLSVMSRKTLAAHIKAGAIFRVWHGVYSLSPPDAVGRLPGWI